MKLRKISTIAAAMAALALSMSSCGQAGAPPTSGTGTGGEAPIYEVNSQANFSDSPVWSKAKDQGKIRVGVKFDTPGLGNRPAGTTEPVGFDIEIAKLVAAHLGFSTEQIEWVETASINREAFIQNGNVDYIVAIYTISDKRKKVIDFAGPYYIAGQDLLVQQDSTITGPDDLTGVRVCSTDGTVPAQRIADEHPEADLVTYDAYAKCVSDLNSGSVDAVTTDDAVLRGSVSQSGGKLKVVGQPFSEEPYGIGLKKNDQALRDAINDALEESIKDGKWLEAFEYTLGDSEGITPPDVDRY